MFMNADAKMQVKKKQQNYTLLLQSFFFLLSKIKHYSML